MKKEAGTGKGTPLDATSRYLLVGVAAVVAWMWSLPLFGAVHAPLFFTPAQSSQFSLMFLVGCVAGFIVVASEPLRRWRIPLAIYGPLASLILTIVLPMFNGTTLPLAAISTFAIVMGALTSPVLAAWGASIARIPMKARGGHVGLVLITASALYGVIFVAARYAPDVAYVSNSILLIVSWRLFTASRSLLRTVCSGEAPRQGAEPGRVITFWILVSLLMISYYSLSWISRQWLFTPVSDANVLVGLVGLMVYGVAAVVGGAIYDRSGEVEGVAMIGLAVLLATYVFVLGVGDLGPLTHLMLEGSYGILDLFVLSFLATGATYLGGSPYRYYAVGLAVNAGVVASGAFWTGWVGFPVAPASGVVVSLIVSGALVIGTVAALTLRWMRMDKQLTAEASNPGGKDIALVSYLTNREREVFDLLMQGYDNQSIGEALKITNNTVKTHVRNIYAKTGASSRTQLILKANAMSDR